MTKKTKILLTALYGIAMCFTIRNAYVIGYNLGGLLGTPTED